MDIYDAPSEPGIVSIPDSAIVRIGTDDVVFVEINEGKYAMLKVHAGESKRGMTPVAGLHPGQKIVVKGGYELKYNLPQAEGLKKAGHFHADGKFHEGDHDEEDPETEAHNHSSTQEHDHEHDEKGEEHDHEP